MTSPKTKFSHPKPFILASASPRRAELLRQAGYTFKVKISPVDEPSKRPPSIPLELWPSALAFIKAYSVAQHHPKSLVLGADTIVVLNNKILGKPQDRAHARTMLRQLSGHRHQVITGIALIRGEQIRINRSVALCYIRKLPEAWLESYLDSNLWQGKAGSYGIQDHTDPWVRLLKGEFSTVVGLPLSLVTRELKFFTTN